MITFMKTNVTLKFLPLHWEILLHFDIIQFKWNEEQLKLLEGKLEEHSV